MAFSSLELAQLRRSYAAIIQGYSPVWVKGVPAFLKHFSSIEQAEIDDDYIYWRDKAVKEGLKTEDARLKFVIEKGVWTLADEEWIKNQRSSISTMNSTKRTLHLPSQIKALAEDIKREEKKLVDKIHERRDVIGMTAETYAEQKINESFIYKALFRDKDLKTPLYSGEEFEEFDKKDIYELIRIHNETSASFSDLNLKKISIAHFFQDALHLCQGSLIDLFGIPIARLTHYQSSLGMYGLYFKRIFESDSRPPEHLMSDPDAITDWITAKTNSKKYLEDKAGDGALSLVGGTKEDYEQLGLGHAKTINQVAQGKPMNMQELMAAQGIKIG